MGGREAAAATTPPGDVGNTWAPRPVTWLTPPPSCLALMRESPATPPSAAQVAIMLRRMLQAVQDPSFVDDRDYYGNKRLELAGEEEEEEEAFLSACR